MNVYLQFHCWKQNLQVSSIICQQWSRNSFEWLYTVSKDNSHNLHNSMLLVFCFFAGRGVQQYWWKAKNAPSTMIVSSCHETEWLTLKYHGMYFTSKNTIVGYYMFKKPCWQSWHGTFYLFFLTCCIATVVLRYHGTVFS